MIAIGAIMLGVAGALLALQRASPAAVAERDARRNRSMLDEQLAITTALRRPETLTLDVRENAIIVDVVDPALRNQAAARTILASIEFFAAETSGSRRPDGRERRMEMQFYRTSNRDRRIAIYRLPLHFTASANSADREGFAAFRQKLGALPLKVSSSDLADAAEAAYLATRPEDFDRTGFYMSRR